jgi:CRISPR/Cas system type I-B associated protein Csh2 (Cas7 group RAMP superfamily)
MLAKADFPSGLTKLGRTIRDYLEQCVELCFAAAKACVANGTLAADLTARLARCSRTCLDCAQACAAACSETAAAIDDAVLQRALRACVAACRDAARLLKQQRKAPDCRQVLNRCADQCEAMAQAIA